MAFFLEPFYRGDTFSLALIIRDATGSPVDISNQTFWFTMKLSTEDSDADAAVQVSLTLGNDTETQAGRAILVVPPTDTSELVPATYFFDVQRVIPSAPDIVQTLLVGKVRVLADISRST